jgi:hypothetical protein
MTSTTSGDSSTVHLKSPKDWTRWLALIKTKATNCDVWQHINPSVASPPPLSQPDKPAKPSPAPPSGDAQPAAAALTATQLQQYSLDLLVWQEELKDYRKKSKAITEIEDHVIRTTGTYWSTIESVIGLHARLVKLKDRVAPTTYAREQEVVKRYEKVQTEAKSTRTEEWLAEWESALRDALELGIPDVQDIRPTRDFLRAVEKVAPLFSQTWSNTIETTAVMTPTADLKATIPDGLKIAQIFRNQRYAKTSGSKASFPSSTLQGEQPPQGSRSRKCPIHGGHPPEDCYVLNKDKRKADWAWNEFSANKVVTVFKKDSKLKEKHSDILTEAQEFLKGKEEKGSTSQGTPPKVTFTGSAFVAHDPAAPPACFANAAYPLVNSFILDSGSPIHICNSTDRFEPDTLRLLDVPEALLTGDDVSHITGYGKVLIRPSTPTGPGLFQLLEVAYVPGFHTNIVSHKRLKRAGYSWDDVNNRIIKNGQVIFFLEERAEQYVVEYNAPRAAFPASSTAPRPPRDADALRWHLRCGHLGQESLERLMSDTYGVRIKGPLTLDCESCIQAKAKQMVSRKQSNQIAPRPLWRIHIDLFHMSNSSTGLSCALAIQDEHTGRIWIYPLPDRTQASVLSTLKSFAAMAKNQWNLKICRIRRDNDVAFGNAYDDWVEEAGIIDEPTPVYTHQPNGRAERSGGVIQPKALAMQLSAQLPSELWPETWQAAAYLHNRSPRKDNLWKAPLELFTKWLRANGRDVPEVLDKPDLSNLYTYGCRAYPLKESIRDTKTVAQKTSPRTHIGYLVGYEASNVFRIWIPSRATVIRSRDVVFKEDEFFDPNTEQRQEDPLDIFRLDTTDPEPLDQHSDADSESDIESTIIVATDTATDITASDDNTDDDVESPEPSNKTNDGITDYPTPASPGTPPGNTPTLDSPHDPPHDYEDDSISTPTSHSPSDNSDNSAEQTEPQAPPPRSSRNRKLTSRAQQNLDQTGNPFQAGYATAPATLVSFHTGTQHRLHRRDLPPEPRTWKEFLQHPFKPQFWEAMEKEWLAIQAMKTLQIIDRAQAKLKPLPLIWVWRYKFDKHGFLEKFKGRICVRGDLQPTSDKDVYAATLAAKSLRTLMALAARWDLVMIQLDAVNAFPNSLLDEEVYIELPDGFKKPGMAARLLRALYGLRRSPQLWQRLLSSTLTDLGLTCVPEEPCLFVNQWLIIFFYVDDIVIMYRDLDHDRADDFRQKLTGKFKMRDLGELRWFLGIRITRDREQRKIWLSQDSYVESIATRYDMNRLQGCPSTPLGLEPLVPNEEVADQASTHLYQRKVGSIMYAAVITRPDVARTVAILSTFLTNPSSDHMAAANRCIQYLYGTRQLGIQFDGKQSSHPELSVYTDASFADNPTDRKSSQGYLMTLFGGPIDWRSSKQDTVTTSSTEAELLALTAVAKEAMATLRLFSGMRLELADKLTIWCDNQQTIRLVNSELPRLRTALRHVDIHSNWARQEVQKKTFTVNYLKTDNMPADGLTKALPKTKFKQFVQQLGLVQVPTPIEEEEEEEDISIS